MRDTESQDHLISDEILKRLKRPDFAALCGDFTEADRAFLSMALPEICAELLIRRENDRTRAKRAQRDIRHHLAQIERRRAATSTSTTQPAT